MCLGLCDFAEGAVRSFQLIPKNATLKPSLTFPSDKYSIDTVPKSFLSPWHLWKITVYCLTHNSMTKEGAGIMVFLLGDSVSRELVREDENQMEQGCQTHRIRFTLI
jgi:hypothetical protein